MSRYHSYLNSAVNILSAYNGKEPFASYLKKYFSANKKFGSKDRKQVSELCYCYFRLGKTAHDLPMEERILTGVFFCSDQPNEILASLKPEWNEKVTFSIEDKLTIANCQLSIVFPWKEELSQGIDHKRFCTSFFIQPDLFLRIRPGHVENVLKKPDRDGISYEFVPPFTLRLPNSFKADQYFELDKEVVVQDLNSQRVGEFISIGRGGPSDKVWDCCAASGGKSIMAYDIDPSIDLTVSDIRESILINLRKRFERAGIKKYNSFVADLSGTPADSRYATNQHTAAVGGAFDLIIADVPCSGSGTWGRTPEQLVFFEEKKIEEYSALQKKIVSNLIDHIRPGGHLLYITCSVFKKENEEVTQFIKEKFHLQTKKMEFLKGYDIKADSMFAELLEKPL